MAYRFASREFCPFEENKVTICGWLFTGVVYTKQLFTSVAVNTGKYPPLFTSTSANNF